ncbi:sensor histidine kinase [Marinifilum caeruleilacunae]|uniref:histidine kinase n=1 Tax=Marinifilum caeruleilacunae TaxID=2499076 RepID=A0ABX1WR80_9BACT|nr:sensor histidine kinase [Marinifilum caeruleilacunae]NOU58585.1 sensor histidine kinase [Marinifilum caeruleilacunae]
MNHLKPTLLFLCVLLCAFQLSAQQSNIRFKRITINDGLSLSSVYCIHQDSKGFMWFGTEDGLNRYDGKNFVIYRSDPENSNTISYKWIEQIFEDSKGKLWLGSRGGLSRFDPVNEQFTQFRGAGPGSSLSNDTITHIFEDSENRLWIGTLKGINCIDITSLAKIQIQNARLISSRVNCILQINPKHILFGTDKGLFSYHTETKSIKKENYTGDQENRRVLSLAQSSNSIVIGTNKGLFECNNRFECDSLPDLEKLQIENLLYDKDSTLWISTNKALLHRSKNSDKIRYSVKSFESSNSLSINTSKPILRDQNNNIWFGTFGSGLFRFNPNEKKKKHYKNNSADAQSLSGNAINCIFEDRTGVIWLGTFGAGISIYDPQLHKFDLLKHDPLDENSLPANFLWSICEDKDSNVWIGTNNQGVSKYNVKQDTFINYDFRASKKLPHKAIRKVYEDRKGIIWIGTDGDGLIRFNPETKSRNRYRNKANNNRSLSNNSVRVIFEDSENLLWIGTQNGLNLFDPETEEFTQFKHSESDANSISHNFVYSVIFEDSKGQIWVGTYGGGLNVYNKQTKAFARYTYSRNSQNCISDNVVFSIYEEKDGILWIGTNNKLNRFNQNTQEFEHFGTEHGLPNNVIYGVLNDSKKNLWLSTNSGICKFSLRNYSCKNFDVHDGLQSNEFNGGAFHKGESGLLYFGGVYGLNIIDPDKEIKEDALYEAEITKLEVHGQPVHVSAGESKGNWIAYDKNTDSYSFSKSIAFTDSIELDYEHRFLSFEFSSVSNFSPDKVNYAYRLQGLEKKWVYSEKRNFASYSNLSPGKYTFEVIAQNPYGKWSEKPRELHIAIHPPFYMTWWFILLEIFVVSAVFIFVYRYLLNLRTNKLLSAQNEQITIANKNLKESEQNLKELVATKDKFFRIISHDLKNPFTSLLSISEMIHENYQLIDEDEKKVGIRKVHESVKHIFNLLENLLTWSRSQTGKIDFSPVEFDLCELISESLSLYSASAEKKQIQLTKYCPEEIMALADRNMCSSVLRNLLNNAIKFSHNSSEVAVKVIPHSNYCEIQVIDQGIGIDKENIDKLFRIDLKYKSSGTAGEKGTGLGLLLCKEFVEANGGNIEVKSELGKGSTFIFTLPSA